MIEVAEVRRRTMQAVKSKNTKPEMTVRRLVHSLGYRYRLHRRNLPGTPDLVFPGRKKLLFVHGCYWHGHSCPRGARVPKTNTAYWRAKIAGNVVRDNKQLLALRRRGWHVRIVWECELLNAARLAERLEEFLSPNLPNSCAPKRGAASDSR